MQIELRGGDVESSYFQLAIGNTLAPGLVESKIKNTKTGVVCVN